MVVVYVAIFFATYLIMFASAVISSVVTICTVVAVAVVLVFAALSANLAGADFTWAVLP